METTTQTTDLLTLSGDGYGLTVRREAVALKQSLLERAAEVQAVTNDDEIGTARVVVKDLAAFRNTLEKSRKAVKEPVLELGRKIDDAAAKFGAEVAAEEKRITALGQAYAAEQERIRREAAEKARREAEEAARKAQEEARRLAAEQAAAQAATRAAEQREQDAVRRAQEEMARRVAAEREAARLKAEAAAAAEAAKFSAPAVAGVKADVDFEVVNVHELYVAHPELVDLTPKRAAILAHLKTARTFGKPLELPGVIVKEKLTLRK